MPAQVPPEGVRYTWSFAIGNRQYQLQAKRTDMASATTAEDPVNHVNQLTKGEFFQLRGACVTNYGDEQSPTTSDFTNAWDTYYAGERVDIGVAAPAANPQFVTYSTPVTLEEGTFSGAVSGLSTTATTVFVRACNGATSGCRYAQVTP